MLLSLSLSFPSTPTLLLLLLLLISDDELTSTSFVEGILLFKKVELEVLLVGMLIFVVVLLIGIFDDLFFVEVYVGVGAVLRMELAVMVEEGEEGEEGEV